MKPLATLLEMLSYCRRSGTASERSFVDRFITPLPGAWRDTYGNTHVEVGDSPILWSCHTDTVHRKDGPPRQTVHLDPLTGLVQLSKRSRSRSACLGADDTAGVFLATQMILRSVPGYYLFHFAEEIGGWGSQDLATHHSDWLGERFKCAIALDRGGYSDVITHQGGDRTASDAFAESLASLLNVSPRLHYAPSNGGTFTDTANYADHICECSNVSVGYSAAHSNRETLDVDHLFALLDRLCTVRFSDLTIDRKPGEHDPYPQDRWFTIGRRYDPTDSTAGYLTADELESILQYDQDDKTIGEFDRDWYLDRDMAAVQSALRRYRH